MLVGLFVIEKPVNDFTHFQKTNEVFPVWGLSMRELSLIVWAVEGECYPSPNSRPCPQGAPTPCLKSGFRYSKLPE